jgi:hypothetical protein
MYKRGPSKQEAGGVGGGRGTSGRVWGGVGWGKGQGTREGVNV